MRARHLVASAATVALFVLGAGATALPASAACLVPCGATFTIAAPAGVGFGADWSPVTLTVATSDAALNATLALDLSGDADLSIGDVFVQAKDGAAWNDVVFSESGGHLVAVFAAPGPVAANSIATVDLRLAVTGQLFSPFAPSQSLQHLAVLASLLPAVVPPTLHKAVAAPDPYDTATANIVVSPLDVTTSPDSTDAELGKTVEIDATLTNNTGTPYHDVIALPLADGVDNALAPRLTRSLRSAPTARTAYSRLKAVVNNTQTVVEFKKDGRWIDFATTNGPEDVGLVDLADGASHVAAWRFTFKDPRLERDSRIGWLAARFAPPADDINLPPSALVTAKSSLDIAGFGGTQVTITDVVAKPTQTPATPSNQGGGNNGGDGTPAESGGVLAATGSNVQKETGLGLLLLGLGAVVVAATRRRTTS